MGEIFHNERGHFVLLKNKHLTIKTHSFSILPVPTTQLAKMNIDLKFVEFTADVLDEYQQRSLQR